MKYEKTVTAEDLPYIEILIAKRRAEEVRVKEALDPPRVVKIPMVANAFLLGLFKSPFDCFRIIEDLVRAGIIEVKNDKYKWIFRKAGKGNTGKKNLFCAIIGELERRGFFNRSLEIIDYARIAAIFSIKEISDRTIKEKSNLPIPYISLEIGYPSALQG